MKNVEVRFSRSAESAFQELVRRSSNEKCARSILDAVNVKVGLLKENPHHGVPVAKRLVPRRYKSVGVRNLFRIALPSFWRMLYTITNEGETLVVFVLDIINHEEYDKLFGYKKR